MPVNQSGIHSDMLSGIEEESDIYEAFAPHVDYVNIPLSHESSPGKIFIHFSQWTREWISFKLWFYLIEILNTKITIKNINFCVSANATLLCYNSLTLIWMFISIIVTQNVSLDYGCNNLRKIIRKIKFLISRISRSDDKFHLDNFSPK